MSFAKDAYLNQTQHGDSRWWVWGIVFWFTVLGWLAAQLVVTSPISPILDSADPELSQQMLDMSMAVFIGEGASSIYLFGGLFAASTVLGLLFWVINRTTKNTVHKIFGGLCGLMVVTSLFSLAKIFPLMTTPELSELNPKIISASPLIFLFILLSFPASLIVPYLGQKFLHQRSIKSLHTAATKIRWNRGFQAFFVTWIVLGLFTAILHFTGISSVQSNIGAERFFVYSLICILFLPLQSATEEIIFRGYLNQGIHHLLKNKWATFAITSFLFMAMHLANPEAVAGKESGMHVLTMSHYFLFGFFACLMVWMDDGLESAIGFHAANNTFAGIFVNYEGSVIPTPSLFIAKSNPAIDVYIAIASLGLITFIMWKTRRALK